MADAKKQAADDGAGAKPKGKLLLFIIVGVVALALVAGGAFMLMKKKSADPDAEDGDEVATKEHKPAPKKDKKKDGAPPAFHKFDKPFTVKLQTEQQEAYLQVEIQLRVLDITVLEQLKQYDPEVKHRIMLILLAKKASELVTPQGVQKLSNEIREAVNTILNPPSPRRGQEKPAAAAEPGDFAHPDDPVQAVLFTSFIVQ